MDIGKVAESILKRSVLRQIKTKSNYVMNGAAVGKDCAIFAPPEGKQVVTCMQEAALKVELVKYVGEQKDVTCMSESLEAVPIKTLFYRGFNNLATACATPFAVGLSLILPMWMEEPQLKDMMKQVAKVCEEEKVQLSLGQTSVSGLVNAPIATAVCYGVVEESMPVSQVKPGQDIVVSKWIGLEGTAILAQKAKDLLKKRYPGYLIDQAMEFDQWLSVLPEAKLAQDYGVTAMHDASKGGIFAALWELAESGNVGLDVDLKKLPIRQETVEVCDFLNVNPYELLSGGCLLMTTNQGQELVDALLDAGIYGTLVGRTTESNDRILRNDDEVRYMDRPRKDSLFDYQL